MADVKLVAHQKLPPEPERLWPGPWSWVLYEIDDPELALRLAARGAHFIETMAIGEMFEHPALAVGRCSAPDDNPGNRSVAVPDRDG